MNLLLEVGQVYSKEDWQDAIKQSTVWGIRKDVLKDRFAPEIDYVDFFMGESIDGVWVYCVKSIPGKTMMDKIMGKKRIKVLGIVTKKEYENL